MYEEINVSIFDIFKLCFFEGIPGLSLVSSVGTLDVKIYVINSN